MNSGPGRIRWRGDHARLNKRWRCSLAFISKSILDRHHQSKLKLKFSICLSNLCHQNFQNIVTWGVELRSRNTIWCWCMLWCEIHLSSTNHFKSNHKRLFAYTALKTSKTDKKKSRKCEKSDIVISRKNAPVAELSKTESFPRTIFSQMTCSWWKVRKNWFQKTFLVF